MSGSGLRIALAVSAVACGLWLGGCASIEGSSEPVAGTIAEQAVSMTATVEKIDLATRLVTLRGPDGKVDTITVSENVKNLPQVKVGDRVIVAFFESLAFEVRRAGEAETGVNVLETAVAAKPGERPAAMGGQAVTVTSTIEAIDPVTPSVTLKGPEGNLVTVKVRDRAKLARVKVGDLVDITYTRAIAVSVEPAK
jgi:Cu/Ag efflux protein CusF